MVKVLPEPVTPSRVWCANPSANPSTTFSMASRMESGTPGESEALAAQVRAAFMSGNQEKIKLLLNQRDPATMGRVMTYYSYLNDFRAGNIATVTGRIRELAGLRSEVAAEEARLVEQFEQAQKVGARAEEQGEVLGEAREGDLVHEVADHRHDVAGLGGAEQEERDLRGVTRVGVEHEGAARAERQLSLDAVGVGLHPIRAAKLGGKFRRKR